jgi:hypothetical protein
MSFKFSLEHKLRNHKGTTPSTHFCGKKSNCLACLRFSSLIDTGFLLLCILFIMKHINLVASLDKQLYWCRKTSGALLCIIQGINEHKKSPTFHKLAGKLSHMKQFEAAGRIFSEASGSLTTRPRIIRCMYQFKTYISIDITNFDSVHM